VSVDVNPGDNLQNKHDNNASETLFIIKSGNHSNQRLLNPRGGITVQFEAGADLDGNDTITTFISGGNNNVSLIGPSSGPLPEIHHYAPVLSDGALDWTGSNWLVRDLWVHHNGTTVNSSGNPNGGMGVRPGPNAVVRRVDSTDNDQYGFGSSGSGILFEDCDSLRNGMRGGHGGNTGGIKFSADDTIFRATGANTSNWSFNNGPGIWGDVGFENYLIEGITFRENARAAVHIEIAANNINYSNYTGGTVRDCLTVKNGYEDQRSLMYDAGVQIGHSPKATIENCISYGDYKGFGGHQQNRIWQPSGGGVNELRDLVVTGCSVYLLANVVTQWAPATSGVRAAGVGYGAGPNPYTAAANNDGFQSNAYYVHQSISNPFLWSGGGATWTEWRAFGLDSLSTFETFSVEPSEPPHPLSEEEPVGPLRAETAASAEARVLRAAPALSRYRGRF
jgi:hypothetical protein